MTGAPSPGRPSRRRVLAGGLALLATPGLRRAALAATPALDSLLAASGVTGITTLALADADTGAAIESWQADTALPPASVTKALTTLYALDALGPDYRFRTAVRADGALDGGVLRGDLALAGGGDPVLDTDALGRLVAALRTAGLRAIDGRLRVAEGALPAVVAIDPGQPDTAGYNAAIAGTNLNFNHVFLAWTPGEAGPKLAFSAPDETWSAAPPGFAAELVPAGRVAHRIAGDREIWTLPRPGIRGRGSIWLPVRAPGAYAGAVFGTLAAGAGITLPAAEIVSAATGGVLAVHASPPLEGMLRDMLRYSTNLTAECVGLRATLARRRCGAPALGGPDGPIRTARLGRFHPGPCQAAVRGRVGNGRSHRLRFRNHRHGATHSVPRDIGDGCSVVSTPATELAERPHPSYTPFVCLSRSFRCPVPASPVPISRSTTVSSKTPGPSALMSP